MQNNTPAISAYIIIILNIIIFTVVIANIPLKFNTHITIPAAMARHNNILIPSNGLHILTRAAKPINKRITIATVDICSLLMPSILP